MSLLIQSGTIITAAETFQGDILVEGEQIAAIGQNLPAGNAEVIDASGLLVLPGGVDAHVHLDLPMFGTVSSDDHYTGTKAAAFGGVTTVIDFISQDTAPLLANWEAWQHKAAKAAVDYSAHMNITRFNQDVAAELPGLVAEGISSVKVFTAYNNRLRLMDDQIFKVMRIAREQGILTMLHAENGDVIDLLVAEALAAGRRDPIWHARTRPAWGAVEAGLRASALAAQAGGAPLYIVHMNAAGEVDMLAYAREQGLPVYGETCPQYLFFSEDDLARPDGAKWICSPPVRGAVDNARLWQGLKNRTLQVVATDHCPFFFDGSQPILYEGQPVAIPGKELGRGDFTKIPNGLPGLGDRLPILWTWGVLAGKLTPCEFVALNCTNPARLFGMYPQKGTLLPGSDADIVLWDPHHKVTYGAAVAQHRTDYNLYEGWQLTGFPVQVFLRGQKIVDHGNWLGRQGMGRWIKRAPFTPPANLTP